MVAMLLDVLLYAIAIMHVIVSPYTKVEESFNLHATHDILMYGVGLDGYDHFIFPGVVPRSFIGSVILANISRPFLLGARTLGLLASKTSVQLIVRIVLATVNASGLVMLRRAVSRRYGAREGQWFAVICAVQFHLPFWMGRTLPKHVRVIPHLLIGSPTKDSRSARSAIGLITATAIIFRAELALFLAPLALQMLITRRMTFRSLLSTGFTVALLAIAATICVDSYFWDQFPIWPELAGVRFNVLDGKSSEWGTSPAHAYITVHLPKLLLGTVPLSLVGLLIDRRMRSLLFPAIIFVALISGLGHKEWRFIVYIIPLVNIASCRGAAWLSVYEWPRSSRKGAFGIVSRLALLGLLTLTCAVTVMWTLISQRNYPGGVALNRLPNVYMDNLAAQTGASLFLEEDSFPHPSFLDVPERDWHYFKILPPGIKLTHAIVEDRSNFAPSEWDVTDVVRSVAGVNMKGGFLGILPTVQMKDSLWILSKAGAEKPGA
ncbi:glycosyltransferase family 22 protein [Hydnum rufescens UP504]|uniref:Mannosyltransferase n=1 Tax=Hydnum rufescens UP504 TaxID=1448309 RepID=A0A9P6AZE5_9AGAM|nr:glycosyltransferase family 22 protein [Hydnum rufescens UP504]